MDGDPRAYTTAWAMDDLDDVRASLGYDQINLYGSSYGAAAAQVYMQRHPHRAPRVGDRAGCADLRTVTHRQ
jgi:pimeloyl-ACP methyl ester carboxylesterase